MSLLLMLFGTQLSTLPPSLAVSKPSVLMSHSQMTKYQVCSLVVINSTPTLQCPCPKEYFLH